ncbi:hypothetical protein CFBP498_00290 [Xanthomonas hortorum pv. vitians]|uniref:Uncharacterized protein n=2 Tax=Xanthomonas hortorum TaxID=56454 RepID=A0A6V7B724_9XANT|nr:hypothetical protein CFBP498_00290 [Xanthomonas hortorum pv. vitians]CAD0306826.1 hypothetical protein CFBP2044_07600 [Xanthomonas hortorum pv. cynarae]CAD0352080.1 hypothetical protein NCPPB940_37360 [Xanthomonas hortorum pv. taraxaci]CAH2709881.1 GGDEF domain-containing protein [Xanthomonas campestris pv. nigromaculans]CAD0298086.1 hypothetical protein CFBP498_00290 [Xanthomonas hortorum pv. vitians]
MGGVLNVRASIAYLRIAFFKSLGSAVALQHRATMPL